MFVTTAARLCVFASILCLLPLPAISLAPEQFNAGALMITEKAMNDGVNRYNQWFWDFVADLQHQPTFPPAADWGGCAKLQYKYNPEPPNCYPTPLPNENCTIITVDQSKVRFHIEPNNKVVVTAPGVKAVTKARVWLRESKHILFWCVHAYICNNNVVDIISTFDLVLTLDVSFDIPSGVITITSEPPLLNNLITDIEGCRPDWWARHVTPTWHAQLNAHVRQAIIDQAAKITKNVNLPHVFFPDPLCKVTYIVDGMLWCPVPSALPCMTSFPEPYIVFNSIGVMQYVPPNGAPLVNFIPDPVYAAISIPLDFPDHGPDQSLPMLTALRMSGVVLTGLMWVADVSGATDYHSNTTILDASFNLTIFYSPPSTGVRSFNILNMTIDHGLFDCRCWLTANASHPDPKPVLVISFQTVFAIGSILYTNDSIPGLLIRVDHIDTSQTTSAPILPPLPLPLDFQKDMVKVGIAGLQPVMNLYLENNPFILPPELVPFTAHPYLTLEPLENILPHGAGYIQMLSLCSFQGQTQYDRCLFHPDSDSLRSVAFNSHGPVVIPAITPVNSDVVSGDSELGLLLNVFDGSDSCAYKMNSLSTVYSLTATKGACLPMMPIDDPSLNVSMYYKLTGYSESLNLSALCNDDTCGSCQIYNYGGLSDACNAIPGVDGSSYTLGEVCKGGDSMLGYVIASYNPSFSTAVSCDIAINDGNADVLGTYTSLGPSDGICRSRTDGSYSLVTPALKNGNINFRYNCDFSNCTSCEIEMNDISPDECIVKNPITDQDLPYPIKIWALTDIGMCDPTKKSIVILVVIILVSVLGFVAGIAIFRILYIRHVLIREQVSLLGTRISGRVSHIREQMNLKSFFVASAHWCLKQASNFLTFCDSTFGWRYSKEVYQRGQFGKGSAFGDVVEFILVCICGACCKWWSLIWESHDDVLYVLIDGLAGEFALPTDTFDSTKFSNLFLQWMRVLSNVVLWFGAYIPISISILWLLTKVGSSQRWGLVKVVSLLLAFLGPVLTLIAVCTVSRIRNLITLLPNTGNFIADSPDGYYYANHAVVTADVALVLNTTFFLFYNMFSGFSGLFLGAAISLACYYSEWSSQISVCCRVRVVLRVVCFIVCPVIQIMICMHPLILWCQDTGEGIELFWDFGYVWLLPVWFGLILDQLVLSFAFEALCSSRNSSTYYIPQLIERVFLKIKYVRNLLNYCSGMSIYCVSTIIIIQVWFLYAILRLLERIVEINTNYILQDSGNFVRASMGATFVVCSVCAQICFRACILYHGAPAVASFDVIDEQHERNRIILESSHRENAGSSSSDGISIPSLSLPNIALSPGAAAPQRGPSSMMSASNGMSDFGIAFPSRNSRAVDAASELSGDGTSLPVMNGDAFAMPNVGGGINDNGEYVYESFVQIGTNGNVYYREFSADYSFCYFFIKLKASLKEWIFETTEALYPEAFGWKVPYRRLSLVIGCVMASLLLQKQMDDVQSFSARDKIQELLDGFGIDLQWPANGTVFDDAFAAYNAADRKQVYCLAGAVGLFWMSLALDVVSSCIFPANLANLEMLVAGGQTGYSILRVKSILLWFSRMTALLGGLLIFGMIIVLATPNYLQMSQLQTICPLCGPEFNKAVTRMAQFGVGMVMASVFTLQLMPLLIAIPPATVRSSVMMLVHPAISRERDTGKQKQLREKLMIWLRTHASMRESMASVQQSLADSQGMRSSLLAPDRESQRDTRLSNIDVHTHTLLAVALSASSLSVLSTFCAMSLVVHNTTDTFNSVLVLLFWFVPPLLFFLGVRLLGYNSNDSSFNMYWIMASYYGGYLVAYFGLFMSLLVYTLDQINAIHILTDTLKKPEFYYEVVAEILLACVCIGDILSMCMSGAPLNSKSRFC